MLHENGDLHFASGLDVKVTGHIGVVDDDRYVATGLFDETVADLAGREKLALAACERRVIHANLHRNGGRIDLNERQRLTLFCVGECLTDEDVFKSADSNNVASRRFFDLDFFKPLMREDRCDFAFFFFTALVNTNNRLSQLHCATDDTTIGDSTQVIAVIEVRYQHAEEIHSRSRWRRDVLNDGLVKRLHAVSGFTHLIHRIALLGAGVDVREIELLVGGIELHEEFKNHVEHLVRTGVLAVDLIDNDDWLETVLHRLAKHEFGLGLRTIMRIHHQKHTVYHFHDALDLSAKIGVTGSIHDIDVVIFPTECGILGADGDALFSFQIHRIHHALVGFLIHAERAGMLEQLIH